MPAAIQDLSLGDHIFLMIVVGGMTLFIVSLFAMWVRDNLGYKPPHDQAAVSPAVRPSEAAVHSGDSAQAA